MLTLDMRKRDLDRRDPAPVVGGGLGLAPEPRSHNLFGWDSRTVPTGRCGDPCF